MEKVKTGWRTIESAPRDGTQFVMFDAHTRTATVGEWMTAVDWINEGRKPGEAKVEPCWFPLHAPSLTLDAGT
jgi:hypothetical protein